MQNQLNAMQANLAARQTLLQTAPPQSKWLGTFTGGQPGGSTRIKLFNVGVITRLLLKVSCTLTTTGNTAAPVLSAQGPWNLIKRLRLTDFNSTDRVNVTGDELFMINCVRRGTYAGYNNEAATATLNNPLAPSNTSATTGNALTFFLEVPIAFDPQSDLRGAILAQTSVGELSLNIDWNSTLFASANADAVFVGGAGLSAVALDTGTSISVDVYQDYLLPQSIGGNIILPELDLLTIYELNGTLKSTDNLAANSEKLINLPNVRSVIGLYTRYVNNGVMNNQITNADMSKLRLIANGNNVLFERYADAQLFEQRTLLNSDTRPGYYQLLFRKKPVETAMYGNVQLGVTPSVVNAGNTYIGVCTESFYTAGTTLPGMSQASG